MIYSGQQKLQFYVAGAFINNLLGECKSLSFIAELMIRFCGFVNRRHEITIMV